MLRDTHDHRNLVLCNQLYTLDTFHQWYCNNLPGSLGGTVRNNLLRNIQIVGILANKRINDFTSSKKHWIFENFTDWNNVVSTKDDVLWFAKKKWNKKFTVSFFTFWLLTANDEKKFVINGSWCLFIKFYWRTVHLYLTEFVVGIGTVSIWQLSSPVVVINNVSTMFDTSYVCRIGYCGSGITAVLETKLPIFFLSVVRYEYRESEKSSCISIVLIYIKDFFFA